MGDGGRDLYRVVLDRKGVGYEKLKEGKHQATKRDGEIKVTPFNPELNHQEFKHYHRVSSETFRRMITQTKRSQKDRYVSLNTWAGLFQAFNVPLSLKDDLEPLPKEKSSLRSLPQVNRNEIPDGLKTATHHIELLNTWLPLVHGLREELIEAVLRPVRMRVLLLNPASPFARIRSVEAGLEADVAETEIARNLTELSSIYDHCKRRASEKPVEFEVRHYDITPAMALYRFDDTVYQGLFWLKKMSLSGPHYEINAHKNAHLFHEVTRHFELLWESAEVSLHTSTGEKASDRASRQRR